MDDEDDRCPARHPDSGKRCFEREGHECNHTIIWGAGIIISWRDSDDEPEG